ncbi:MAG: YbbR-like domain-containing protein [Winogradskyella sp.]|uniref:CdaR family protein n=1 Tax=Winogradskyella sp. TaxID=1883156 RepID=UPI0018018845|nr:YbbR-like domain-containing protein [Winogradskyella sp.]
MKSKKQFKISEYLKKKNVKRFSFFIVIAFVFLVFSKLSDDYKQTISLKLKLINLEDEIIIQEDSLDVIYAYVEAKGFALVPFIFKGTKEIIVDASAEVTTRPNQFIFDTQKQEFLIEDQFGKSLKLINVKPDTVILEYSKRASKMVPVILNKAIKFDVGYDVKGEFKLSQDSVKVVGPLNIIEEINYLESELISLSDVKTSIDLNTGLNASKYKAIEVFPKEINVQAEVLRFTEGQIEVPVTIVNGPEQIDINYFPKSVTATFYVDLENYKTIKASDFRVECDYNEVEKKQSYLTPKIVEEPEFVKRTNLKQKRIDFIKL